MPSEVVFIFICYVVVQLLLTFEMSLNCSPNTIMQPRATCGMVKTIDEFRSQIFSSLGPENLISARPIWEMDNSDQICQLDDQDDFSSIGKVRLLYLH